jgi:hypothetical protein
MPRIALAASLGDESHSILPTSPGPGPPIRDPGSPGLYPAILSTMATLLPLAHTGHWLWVLYLPPVLIVIASIVGGKVAERRRKR